MTSGELRVEVAWDESPNEEKTHLVTITHDAYGSGKARVLLLSVDEARLVLRELNNILGQAD